jgi:uncharacterized protein YcbK (DUF882 family)|uniref:Peptidase M15A C-terminal domain-containing protein n=1 Tax=uncultured marine virus TaxID=186617 RepID=A0A0F7L7X2_9VIRU|nr:hypothetical protein [uncultured marine virus]
MFYEHHSLVRKIDWQWENFSPAEIACRHCGAIRISPDFLDRLQGMRNDLGPIAISCCYRCPVHNARVGGAPGSMHLMGKAADVQLGRHDRIDLARAARRNSMIGLGYYVGFLHVDTGRPRWWGNKELWT